MDGVLRVTTTSTPSILAFEIYSYSGHFGSYLGCDISVVEMDSAAGVVDTLVDTVKTWYLEQLKAEFMASGETQQ